MSKDEMINDELKMKLDTFPIPMPDGGFEARLFGAVSAHPRALVAANDNRISAFIKRHSSHLAYGAVMAAMLALAISIDTSSLLAPDPMIGDVHMLADVDYMPEEQLFAGLDDMIY